MSVDNRGTTDVPRWYYSFMIRRVRYFGSIPEARTKAEALKVEAMKRLEVYEGRYGKEPGVKDFCEFVDQFTWTTPGAIRQPGNMICSEVKR